MSDHKHYEVLCVLAATHQIEDGDRTMLETHLVDCPECQNAFREITEIGLLLVSDPTLTQTGHGIPEGMKDRLAARFRSAGIEVSPNADFYTRAGYGEPPIQRPSWRWIAFSAMAVIAVCLTLWFARTPAVSPVVPPTTTESSKPLPLPSTPAPGNERLENELAAAEARARSSDHQIKVYQEQLVSARQREHDLMSRIAALETGDAVLRDKQAHDSAELLQARQQMVQLRAEKDAIHNASIVEQAELVGLQARINKLSAEQERERRANVANAPCGALTERNLHVIPIHDADTESIVLGRVIYVEGKCLTFYAYDLPDQAVHQTISFYAWGGKKDEKSVKNLGVFRPDNLGDHRWILTFDDPQVLAQINTVFVTAETGATVAKYPQGKPILKAFLGNKRP